MKSWGEGLHDAAGEEEYPNRDEDQRQAERGRNAEEAGLEGTLHLGEDGEAVGGDMLFQKPPEFQLRQDACDDGEIDQDAGGDGDDGDEVVDEILLIAVALEGGFFGGIEGDGVGGKEEGLGGDEPTEALGDEAVLEFDLRADEVVIVEVWQFGGRFLGHGARPSRREERVDGEGTRRWRVCHLFWL